MARRSYIIRDREFCIIIYYYLCPECHENTLPIVSGVGTGGPVPPPPFYMHKILSHADDVPEIAQL